MKNKTIIIWFIVIALAMFLIWICAYRPTFSTSTFSAENTDWGGFGDFFWGLGVMCFTGLNVYVFWQIQQQMLRDSLVRELRSLTEKIRDAQSLTDEKVITSRIESFKFAVGSTMESGLLSKSAIESIKRLLTRLQPDSVNFETAPYFCEAIIYAISINKSIDDNSNDPTSSTFSEIGLLEKINLWDKKSKEQDTEQAENAKKEGTAMRSFADYLQGELLAARRLSVLYPKARVYPQKRIPQSELVMDALVVPKEGGKEMIVEIKTRLSEKSAQKAVQQLLLCRDAYKNAYNKEPDLGVAITEDPRKYLPLRVIKTIVNNEFNIRGINYIELPDMN